MSDIPTVRSLHNTEELELCLDYDLHG
jgi:hypothetical protein